MKKTRLPKSVKSRHKLTQKQNEKNFFNKYFGYYYSV
jgi:hypothetical protein